MTNCRMVLAAIPYKRVLMFCLFSGCGVTVDCLNITFVSYGYGPAFGKGGVAKMAAAGLSVAIDEYRWYRNTDYTDLNLTCNLVVLEIPNSVDCRDAEANYYMVTEYYYGRKWDDENIMTLITPGCGDSLITGTLAREWDVFMGATAFSYGATRDRLAYPSYITFASVQVAVMIDAMLAFFDRYNWTSIAVIYDGKGLPSYYELIPILKVLNNVRKVPLKIGAVEINPNSTQFSPSPALLTVKTFARIIVLSMHPTQVRKFMLAAHQLQMDNGEYVYVTITASPGYASGNLTWEAGDGLDETAFQAFRQLFHIRPCIRTSTPQNLQTQQSIANANTVKYDNTFYPGDDNPSEYNIAAYQAFYVYVQILSEIHNSGRQDFGGRSIAQRMLDRQFDTTFGSVYIDNGGQRRSRQCFLDLNVTTRNFQTVIEYDPYNKILIDEKGMELDFGPTGAPKNEPKCGYQGNNCKSADASNNLSQTIPAVIVTLAVLGIFLWFLYRRLEREHQLRSNSWMIDAAFLEPVGANSISTASFKSNKKNNYSLHNYDKPDYLYRAEPVSVKIFIRRHGRKVLNKRKDKKVLLQIMQVSHPNIVRFLGVCMQTGPVHFVQKFCVRGNLLTLLANATYNADWELRCSLLSDLIEGISYIHDSPLKRHGSLSASICLIDVRFTLLISELGFVDLVGPSHNLIAVDKSGGLLNEGDRWADSTLTLNLKLDASDDVLALAFIMIEVLKTAEITSPAIKQQMATLHALTSVIVNKEPKQRPSIGKVKDRFRQICKVSGNGLLVNILTRMETYAAQLEKQVQERTVALAKERAVCDDLLLEMLPRWILDQLYFGTKITPEVFASSTVFFSHIWGFLYFVSTHSPYQIFDVVNGLFTRFDKALANFAVYKVETVEDQYMVFSGKSDTGVNSHASEICRMALSFKREFSKTRNDGLLQFMAGIHTGPCAAGVIGHKCPRYCLFGDTINVASRISSNSKPSRIHLSVSTADIVGSCPEFVIKQRGLTSLKGRGDMQTYWLTVPEHIGKSEASAKTAPEQSRNWPKVKHIVVMA